MKNIFRYSILLALCSFVGLVSCAPEELSTDQFSDDTVVLGAFAPNPVVRGAELRIMGSNLDKIVEVQIPGAEPITEIELVASGRVSEIRVVTPKAGAEDESVTGPVVLIDADGNTYKSKTELSFTEGIVLDSFTPAEAMPGDVVTVKGDYLYNVQQIVLGGGVYVTGEQITQKSRRELKFIVPSNAITGPVTIGDVDENNNPDGLIPNNVPSEEELVIGDPTVKAADRGMLKAGAEITVQGSYLDMIEKVAFRVTTPAAEEGAEPTVADTDVDFVLAKDNKSVKVVLPATVADGEIVLTSFAGKEFKAGAYTTVIPTAVAIAAETRYKAGLKAVVTGKDLDLVTSADLSGEKLDIVYADNKLTFAIPAKAVDGVVTLALANGKTVATEAIELVKPTVTGLSVSEVVAGESFVVDGTDLDLISSVTLKGDKMEYEYDAESGKITVVTVGTSVGGPVELLCENDLKVVAGELTVTYDSFVVVSSLPSEARIGDEITMTGANFNMIEAIYFGEVKVTGYTKRADDEMVFVIPAAVETGTYNMKFVLTTGEEETCASSIDVKGAMTTVVLWEGTTDLGTSWDGSVAVNLAFGADWGTNHFARIPYGSTLHVEFTANVDQSTYYQLKICDGTWTALANVPGLNEWGSIDVSADATHFSYQISKENHDLLYASGLVVMGYACTVTKVYVTYENADVDLPLPSDIMVNDFDQHGEHNASWDNSWAGYATGKIDGDNGYLEVTSEGSGWLINCNHQSAGQLAPYVEDSSKYNVKFDIWIPEGAAIADNSVIAQVIFCDSWYWIGNLNTGDIAGKGKWMTWTIDYSNAKVPAVLDMSSGAQGLSIESSGALLPVGTKIDNFRLSLK